MLAKVCSDKNKPNGQYRLLPTREAVMDFIQALPVRKVCGIGKVSEKMLNSLGITTCAHLGQQMALLSLLFSETAWHHFMQIALGLGSTFIPRHEERKSMSTERTFKELSKPDEQLQLCRKLCEDLAEDLSKEGLKGKTITLKLKNVNFEVKTRAQTLPNAVATVEDIYAVAKDLLEMEIENEIPQPLRLRLMGVRISAFVSVEDKTPMQKSIIGFLQPGKMDCSRSSQIIHQNLEKEQLSHHPVQTSQPLAHLAGQTDRRREEACWQSEQGRSGKRENDEKPQESFFQRARAKRLQLLAANSNTQAEGCGEDISKTTSIRSDSKEGGESSQSNDSSAASDLIKKESVISVQAHSSTSGCGTQTESLTCPVCFTQVQTTDLNVFNRHIDRCLNGDAGKLNKSSAAHLDPENQTCEMVHEQNGAHEVKNGPSVKSKELESSNTCLRGGQQSLKDGSAQKDALIEDDNKPRTLQEHRSCGKSPVLVCPVCQATQDTDDLAVFNRHVDLCLNQEVLRELGGEATFTRKPSAVKNSGTKDSRPQLSRQGSKGKIKRRDTPSSPLSKKAKSGGSCNTIDKFLR